MDRVFFLLCLEIFKLNNFFLDLKHNVLKLNINFINLNKINKRKKKINLFLIIYLYMIKEFYFM
jgi:hypothetical protein